MNRAGAVPGKRRRHPCQSRGSGAAGAEEDCRLEQRRQAQEWYRDAQGALMPGARSVLTAKCSRLRTADAQRHTGAEMHPMQKCSRHRDAFGLQSAHRVRYGSGALFCWFFRIFSSVPDLHSAVAAMSERSPAQYHMVTGYRRSFHSRRRLRRERRKIWSRMHLKASRFLR